MTSLYYVAFSDPDWKPHCAAWLLLAFWRPPAVSWRPACLHCIAKPLSHFPLLSPCLCTSVFLQQAWSQHWIPFSCSPPPLSLSVSADRSFLVMFQAIWALQLNTGPSHLLEWSLLWCVFFVRVCCLVVLVTCCPSLWRPSWSWWTTASSPGTRSLWPSSRRSARKMSHLTEQGFVRNMHK